MAIHINKNSGFDKNEILAAFKEILDAEKSIKDTEVVVNVDKKSVKNLENVEGTINDTSSAMQKLANNSKEAASSISESMDQVGKATQRASQQMQKNATKLKNATTEYRKIARIFNETEHKLKSMNGSAQLQKSFSDVIDKRIERKAEKSSKDLGKNIEKYKEGIKNILLDAEGYSPKGKHASHLYNDTDSNTLYNEKEVIDSANRYANAIRKSGKIVDDTIIKQIQDREKLYHTYKTLESSINFNNDDFTDKNKNEQTVKTLSKMIQIAKQIKYIDETKIGMSNKEHLIDVSAIKTVSADIVNKIIGNDGISQAFKKEYESTKLIMESFFDYLRDGDKNGFDKSTATKFFDAIQSESKEVTQDIKNDINSTLNEFKKAEKYISDDTKLTGAAKDAWNKFNRESSKDAGLSQKSLYQFIGQIANIERNGGTLDKSKNAWARYEKYINENEELRVLAEGIKNYQSSTAVPLIDTEKIKEAKEEIEEYKKVVKEAQDLGIDISNLVSTDEKDAGNINNTTKAIRELVEAKKQADKVGIGGQVVDASPVDKNGVLSGDMNAKTVEEFTNTTVKASKAFREMIDVSNVKMGSDELYASLTSAMTQMKALFDAGQTDSLEYLGILYRIAEIQKKIWQFNGMVNKSPYDQISPEHKDASERMSIQDSIMNDFNKFSGASTKMVDFVIDEFTRLKHAGQKIFGENGKIIGKTMFADLTDMLYKDYKPLNKTEVLSGTTPAVRAQKEIKEELKDTRAEAEKTAEAIANIGKGKPGNPEQILYHNSDSVFDSFDMSKAGEHGGLLGNGAYFSLTNSDTYSRADFGKYQTQWIANVQNIFDTFVGFSDEEIERIMQQYFSDKSEQIQKELRSALKSINVNAKPSIGTIQELGGIDFGKIVQSLGYDATLREDELAVYDSSKIQRANTSVYNNELREYIDLTKEATSTTKELNDVQQGNQTPLSSSEDSSQQVRTLEQVNAELKEEEKQVDNLSEAYFELFEAQRKVNEFREKYPYGDSYYFSGDYIDDKDFTQNGTLASFLKEYFKNDKVKQILSEAKQEAKEANEIADTYYNALNAENFEDDFNRDSFKNKLAFIENIAKGNNKGKQNYKKFQDLYNFGHIEAELLDGSTKRLTHHDFDLGDTFDLYKKNLKDNIKDLKFVLETDSRTWNDEAEFAMQRFGEGFGYVFDDIQDIIQNKLVNLFKTDDRLQVFDKFYENYEFGNPFTDDNAGMDFYGAIEEAQEEWKRKANETLTLTLNEESSGQLAFQIEGVKEASFEVKNAQEAIQAEAKETNQILEGQVNLFDYLKDVEKEKAQIEAAKKAKEIGQVFGITNKNALKEIQDVILAFKQNSGELQTDENGFIIGDFGDELDMFANAGASVKDVLDTISKHIKSSKENVDAYSESWKQVREYVSKSKLQLPEGLKAEFGDNWKSMLSTIGRGNFDENGAKISEFLEEMNAEIGTTFDFSNEKNAWLELYEFLKHKPLQVDVGNLPDSISEIVNQILNGTYKEETNRKYNAKNVKFKDAKFVRQNYELEQQEHAKIVEQSEKKQQKAHEETAKAAEEKADRVIASQDKVEEFLNRNTGKKLISTLDSDTVKSRTYQDEAGRTYTEGIRYNEKIVEWEDFNKELTNYTQLEKEAVKYTNQLALAYADLEKEQRKAKPDTLVLATLNQQIELLESRLEDVKAQAISYANETGLGKEYNYDLFEERVSRQTDEYAAKLAVKSAEQIRKENEANLKAIQKQDAFINKAKSSYAKKLSSINSSFSNLTEYKNVESLINNIANVDDINKIEVAFNKLEKVINDFKQNVKSTASLDPVFAAISKKGHLDNIVEKYQLEFEKLGLSVKDAKQEVKDFKEIADNIGKINLNDKDGMKRFGEELHRFNAEEDRLKSIIDITKQRNEIQKRTTQDATKSYKEKFQVIDKYAKAQDELNRLRGKEVKQGKDDEIIAEIKVKQKEVAILRENAIKASKALSAMNREGLITTDQKRIAQNLLKDANRGGVDSSTILSGILDKQASKHGSEIGDITFKYQKLGLTSDETKQKLKDLLDAQKEVNNISTGSVDKRIQKELQYQEALKNAKNELIEFTRQEQLRLKEERANSTEEKATNKSYKDKYSIIEKYSKAQDELNKLLGDQVKHGKSEELTSKIIHQTKAVVSLRKEAEDATKAIVQMWGAGNIGDPEKENALRLWNNVRLKKTDSFDDLNAIKADKAKEIQYAGQTRDYERLLTQIFTGQTHDDAVFRNVSVDKSGKTTLTFLEIVGDKAREIKVLLDDANNALDEMKNGTFTFDDKAESIGRWRNKRQSDTLSGDGTGNYISDQIDAYQQLIKSEDKYQKLKAKSDNGSLTQSQQAELVKLEKERENYNNTINKSIILTKEEQELYDKFGKYLIESLKQRYAVQQEKSKGTYDAYYGKITDPAKLEKINAALEYQKNLMSELRNKDVKGYGSIFTDAEEQVKQLNISLETGQISVEQYYKEIDKIGTSLKNTIAVVKPHSIDSAKEAIQQYVKSIEGASISSFDEQTGKATITVERHGQVVREMSAAYNQASGQIEITKDVTKETEGVLASFGRSLNKRFRSLLQYLMTFASFYDIVNKFRNGIAIIRDLDASLTEMRKVSDESIESLRNFQDVSFDIAGSIGATAKQIQESSADFMRLGYSLEEASKLAKDANIYANVGDMEIDEATEHMISSIKAWGSEFNSEVEASEAIIDRYNEIGNNFAISSADIGSAMERSAAALKEGGNTLNEALGLITAGNIIQQDAETTANALKILSLRIRGSKTELEEMGESTEGLASSSSKLREEIKALSGVDIMADDNTYKSTAQIIQELGKVYNQMSDVSQAALLEKIAGKNRASTVAGLLENYKVINEVIESAEKAEGSALRENERYLDSIEGKISQFNNEVQEFWHNLIDSETIKNVVDAGTKILDFLGDIVDILGEIGTAGAIAGAFLSIKFSKNNSGGRDKKFSLMIKYATESFSREVCEF